MCCFAADMLAHGVAVIGADMSVSTYPITHLPTGHDAWQFTRMASLVASLTAFTSASYATLGMLPRRPAARNGLTGTAAPTGPGRADCACGNVAA